ncbi:hypothetical protein CFOL_v3_29502 [Cephalotus follicularis]|uniref:Uncharacterized protein n=1 Tax=Cephalotus follicularis TaxID=3775 RepID=A0A1Q3D0Q7_CEPFO|nr:hypothetical protein CFOL_v3_29502 [Cephalotus follicularis]
MATLSVGHSFHTNRSPIQEVKSKSCPRIVSLLSCSSKPKKEKKENMQLLSHLFVGVKKYGEGLKENLSPQQKGDWKDLMLMCLSFAVFVYMSQKIVCAYCAWMSMPKHLW